MLLQALQELAPLAQLSLSKATSVIIIDEFINSNIIVDNDLTDKWLNRLRLTSTTMEGRDKLG